MWLLDAQNLVLEDFTGKESLPRYAILSHTWGEDEVSWQDIADLSIAQEKAGFQKIAYICEQARQHGLGYVWVDTCELIASWRFFVYNLLTND
jgi:hypothetical protein